MGREVAELILSLLGLLLAFACITGGVVLFLAGVVGGTHWTANVLGIGTELSDAAPGALLSGVGLLVILITGRHIAGHPRPGRTP